MINIPYNVPLTSQIMPTQNVPVQTSHNSFQPFQQPPTNAQQMQTNPVYPMNMQDPYRSPFYQFQHSDMFMANQCVPNVLQPRTFQPFNNVPPALQTQPNYNPLLQSILEQIRGQVSSAAPIFILPGGCQQSANHHQQAGTPNQGGGPLATGQPTSLNYPSSVHCPPSFYPYPIPLPVYEPFVGQTRNRESSRGCGCCHRRQESSDTKNYSLSCCCNLAEQEDHRCTATNDDTICSKRNCPASVSLQALASQFLSLPGIVSCAATRLILRKVPGSNITNTMEDTMDKAQKAITMLSKEQLLAESRNAQQVNALINLHMTTNPPANIIPLLTLIQLKVNVLKAQIESLINKKVMECQGFGYQVETSDPIDPTVLTMKTNEELRHLLSALRQKECDERVNVNFSPYHSQRVIAESRLNNVQAKIRQVEAEFDRRRSVSLPVSSLTSRVIQQFAGSTCTFGFAQTKLFEPYPAENPLESPDPFSASLRNPRKLYLKPRVPEPETAQQRDENKATGTSQDAPPVCKDTGTGEGNVDCSKERSVGPRSSEDSCSCHLTSSEESIDEGKKKLRLRVDRAGRVTISSLAGLEDASLVNFGPNVVLTTDQCRCKFSARSASDKERDITDRESEIREIVEDADKETGFEETSYPETKDAEQDKTEDKKEEDFKDEILDKPKEEDLRKEDEKTFDDGQLLIKEEPKTDTDIGTIKTEPENVENVETSDNVDVKIKTEEPEDKPSRFRTMLQIDLKSKKKKKTVLQIEPKQTAMDERFVTEKQIQIDEKPEESKKLETRDIKVEDETETRGVGKTDRGDLKSVSVKTKQWMEPKEKEITTDDTKTKVHVSTKPKKVKTELYVELKQKPLQGSKDTEPREKSTIEDVSKDKVNIIVTPPDEKTTEEEPSSEVQKSYFGITMKKAGESKHRSKIKNDEVNDAATKEKLIIENVSEQQATGSATPVEEQPPKREGSSEVQKSYFGITLKKAGESKHRSKIKNDEVNDAATKEKLIIENVSEQQATGSAIPVQEQPPKREGSSEVHKSYLGITLKKAGESKHRSKIKNDEVNDAATKEKLIIENISEQQATGSAIPVEEQPPKREGSSEVHKSYLGITLKKAGESKHRSKIKNDEVNDPATKEKLIIENVSKQQATGSAIPVEEQPPKREGSSEVHKSYLGITLKKAGESKHRSKIKNDEVNDPATKEKLIIENVSEQQATGSAIPVEEQPPKRVGSSEVHKSYLGITLKKAGESKYRSKIKNDEVNDPATKEKLIIENVSEQQATGSATPVEEQPPKREGSSEVHKSYLGITLKKAGESKYRSKIKNDEVNDPATKEKLIIENVSKQQATGSAIPVEEQPPKREGSSEVHKSYLGITLKKAGESKHRSKIKNDEVNDPATKEKLIIENVSEQQATGSAIPVEEQPPKREGSSEVHKSYLGITLKKAGESKHRSKIKNDEVNDAATKEKLIIENVSEQQATGSAIPVEEQPPKREGSSEVHKSYLGITLKKAGESKHRSKIKNDEVNDAATKEKLIIENVSEQQATGSAIPVEEQPPKREGSSEVQKSYFGITLKKAGESKHRSKIKNDEINDAATKEKLIIENVSEQQATGSAIPVEEQPPKREGSSEVHKSYFAITLKRKGDSKRRSKTKNDESRSKNGKHGNVQIVSMMTYMEHDRGFGDFDEWVDVNERIGEKIKDHESRRTKDNSLMLKRHEKMFPKNHRPNEKKYSNGVARFPPLKSITRRVIDAPENIFHQEEIESGSSKTVCHRNTTYHPDSENSIVSAIYSVIENQLTSFGSLFANISNLQDVVSTFCHNKWSNIICKRNVPTSQNEKETCETDEWILLPENDEDETSGESRVSVSQDFGNVRRMKQSIIVDKETNNYVLLGGSISAQSQELSRNGFKRPYHTHRTLVIRSRLKNPGKFKDLRPLTILKRAKKNKTLVSQEIKLAEYQKNTRINKNQSFLSVDRSLSENKNINVVQSFERFRNE